MRFWGLIMICLPVSLTGLMYIAAVKKRARLCLALSELTEELSRCFTETGADLIIALGYIGEKEKFSCFGFISAVRARLQGGEELREVWQDCVRNDSALSALTPDEREILLPLYECFDSSSTDELSVRLSVYSVRLKNAADEENRRLKKNGGAAAGLSALGAAALFIIFI